MRRLRKVARAGMVLSVSADPVGEEAPFAHTVYARSQKIAG